MLDNSVLAGESLRHGIYLCLRFTGGDAARAAAGVAIPALAAKLGLESEFEPAAGPPTRSIAFLRRPGATLGAIADEGVEAADAVVHVAAPAAQPVDGFCREAVRLRVVGGVVRPRVHTGAAMNNFAYAHAVVQQPAGIPCLLRRTYKSVAEPASEGAYDFVTYFECADADVPTFHRVCASLRDVRRNPEWAFVREGPTWRGRRVATWPDLFAERGR
jgi:hypothetical protein